jgi:hypothetical protein
MRKITLLILLLTGYSLATVAQSRPASAESRPTLQPHVDRRVELLSIVFRLAGNEEYNQDRYKGYVEAIHSHFEPHKDHPAVAFARKVAAENSVGFDAVMSMAVHLSNPPALEPVIPFTAAVPESRWGAEKAGEFALLLRQFYRDAGCEAFFNDNQPVYEAAVQNFRQVLGKVDTHWYKTFYGKAPEGAFNVVIGLGNGGGNYGPKVVLPDGHEEIYAIMGTWATDRAGGPVYPEKDVLPIIIHEFNHSFANSLIDHHELQLRAAGEKIFGQVAQKMRPQAYGTWKTMMYEALVRACVIRYMLGQKAAPTEVEAMIAEEEEKGFLRMGDLVRLLDEYEKDRRQYHDLESFMPRLVKFYEQVAASVNAE